MIRPEYKQIVVAAHMAEEYRLTQRQEQVGMQKVTKMRGILKPETYEVEKPIYETVEEWVPTGEPSDTEVDAVDFAKRITVACNDLHDEGYDVISMQPVLRGVYGHNHNAGVMEDGTGLGGWGYGFGYSITDSMIIIGKLRPDEPREVPDPPDYVSVEDQIAMEEAAEKEAAEKAAAEKAAAEKAAAEEAAGAADATASTAPHETPQAPAAQPGGESAPGEQPQNTPPPGPAPDDGTKNQS